MAIYKRPIWECRMCGAKIKVGQEYAWCDRNDLMECSACYNYHPHSGSDWYLGTRKKEPKMGYGMRKVKKPIPGQISLLGE